MTTEDERFAAAVAAVERVAATCGVPILLIGAYARDLLLEEWGAKASGRRTRDVDFAVRVHDWIGFRILRDALLATGQFQEGASVHQVLFQGRMEVDLVPFGEIAGPDGRLSCWPEDFRNEMNVIGYQEAYDRAGICPGGSVPMVTLPAFVGLKVLSWNEDPDRRAKDAVDLAFVLRNLAVMDGVLDAVSEWPDEDWDDLDRRCQRWLGTQVGSVFGERSRMAIGAILSRESSPSGNWRMARQMASVYPRSEEARLALERLLEGLGSGSGEVRPG